MESYQITFIIMLLVVFWIIQSNKRKNAVIIKHRKNHKNKELFKMKELAQRFIGKECLIYTVSSDTSAEKGIIKEITENGILLDNNGNRQAINIEYVTRIREWPRNAKGKKKTIAVFE